MCIRVNYMKFLCMLKKSFYLFYIFINILLPQDPIPHQEKLCVCVYFDFTSFYCLFYCTVNLRNDGVSGIMDYQQGFTIDEIKFTRDLFKMLFFCYILYMFIGKWKKKSINLIVKSGKELYRFQLSDY